MKRNPGVRLAIDWTRCEGRGLCIELLPEVLTTDPWGYPLAKERTKDLTVPAHLGEHARRAVDACPRLALRLTAPDGH